MCTVLIGRDVTGKGGILVAANRDEDPARPSDPPRILSESPRVAGGRDRLAGGTWLAVRAVEPAVTMLLNRRPIPGAPPGTRSRGLLTLDVARASDPRAAARTAAASGQYGPCTLVHVSAGSCWWLAIPGPGAHDDVRTGDIPPGWHAITHAELDDASEPRTAWLMGRLAGLTARAVEPALGSLAALLAHHGDATSPAVCIHEGRMSTVSAALIALTRARVTWRHAEGRPCTTAFSDASALLSAGPANAEAP